MSFQFVVGVLWAPMEVAPPWDNPGYAIELNWLRRQNSLEEPGGPVGGWLRSGGVGGDWARWTVCRLTDGAADRPCDWLLAGAGLGTVRVVAPSAGGVLRAAPAAGAAAGAVRRPEERAAAQLGGLADAAQSAAGSQQRAGGQPAHDPGAQQGGRPQQGALWSVPAAAGRSREGGSEERGAR